MCTRVVWKGANDAVVVGRNMDFRRDLMTNLWSQPRGIVRNDGVAGELTWTSKYGSLVATAFDMISVDGINEQGLAGHVLWLAESDYGSPTAGRAKLSQAIWMQYFLDNFSTVAESVAWIKQTEVQVVQMPDPTGGEPPTIHLALDDATGDSCIIEYVDGEPNVYHSPDYRVMTNSPTYDKQLKLLEDFNLLGDDAPVPGSTLASDRFLRASYYVNRLQQPKSRIEAIAAMSSVMHNAAQPFRSPDPGQPDASQTLWQTVSDLTNKLYVFESTTRPNVVWIDLHDLDLSPGAAQRKLDLVRDLTLEDGLAGNVGAKLEDQGELKFLSFQAMAAMDKAGPDGVSPLS